MKLTQILFLSCLTALLAIGCGDDDTGAEDTNVAGDTNVAEDTNTTGDTGGIDTSTATTVSCAGEYPTDGFGTQTGRNFESFALNQCDGTPYEFLNEEFCDSSLTIVSIAAGWCAPCIAESRQLKAEITDRYEGRGVRLIQILTQTEDFSAPDEAYCAGWVERFGLENIELIDPAQTTNRYFPDGALPSTLIVGRDGVIKFRENGASDGLTTLRAAVEAELAAVGR